MALQRYSSQVVTENRPVYADAGAFRYSDAASQVVGNLGQELGQVANVADQMAQVQKRLDEKYQNHIDSLQMTKANDFLQAASASIDGVYESVKDTTQWDGLVRKEIDKANGSVRQILSTMSPQAREFAEQQMKQFGEMQTIKMRSLRAKTAASQNLTMLMSTYETAISQGNDQQAEMARIAMDERWNDWYGSKEEYESALKTIEDRGIQEYNQNQLNIVRDEVAAMAELQTPIEDISQFIDDTMPDASNRAELKQYANTISEIGQLQSKQAKVLSKTMADNKITEAYKLIREGETDIRKLTSSLDGIPQISDADKKDGIEAITNYYKSFASAIEVPVISSGSAIAKMESASSDLMNGRISKRQYEETFSSVESELSQSHRDKYLMEKEPSYGKMVSTIKSTLDDMARRSMVTRTDVDLIELSRQVSRQELPAIMLSAASIKNKIELGKYSDYQMDVLDIIKKYPDATQEELTEKIKYAQKYHESRDWVSIYREHAKSNKEIASLESSIRSDFNALAKSKNGPDGAWDTLPPEQRAAIINFISEGQTLENAIRLTLQKGNK